MENAFMKSTEQRLLRLETAVFGPKEKLGRIKPHEPDKGPTGGLRVLIEQGFFKSKRSLSDSRSALGKQDYHYSTQAVDMALKRLSKRDGPLVSFKEGGKKLYAKRK
jgi:hypothetical protein